MNPRQCPCKLILTDYWPKGQLGQNAWGQSNQNIIVVSFLSTRPAIGMSNEHAAKVSRTCYHLQLSPTQCIPWYIVKTLPPTDVYSRRIQYLARLVESACFVMKQLGVFTSLVHVVIPCPPTCLSVGYNCDLRLLSLTRARQTASV